MIKRILLTGSSGLLGQSIHKKISSQSIDILSPGRKELNLLSKESISKYFSTNKFDTIIHCAAIVGGIQANISDPISFIVNNILIDFNLIQTSLDNNISNFIFFGSSCMYPKETDQPMKEFQILTGHLEPTNSSYAMGKLATMELIRVAAKSTGKNYRTLILSNLYGENEKLDKDKNHLVSGILQKFIEAESKNTAELEIWGTGNAKREFTHVNDIADWLLHNLNRIEEFPQEMNIGYGLDFTVKQYYDFFQSSFQTQYAFNYNHSIPDGMKRKLLDSTLARRDFDWNPKISPDIGINMMIQKYRAGGVCD